MLVIGHLRESKEAGEYTVIYYIFLFATFISISSQLSLWPESADIKAMSPVSA